MKKAKTAAVTFNILTRMATSKSPTCGRVKIPRRQ
jgi:hypothetical protein